MDSHATPSLAEQATAARDWWRDAGVDCLFADEPSHWLQDLPSPKASGQAGHPAPMPAPAIEKPTEPPPARLGGEAESWPGDLQSFAAWWVSEPTLAIGGTHPRIPPRGRQHAKLMVLAPEPEEQDAERLLSGPNGNLLASFLGAAAIGEEDIYVATVLPSHTPMPDWPALIAAGLDAITRHHIEIAMPERLLIFGADALPLIGHDPAQNHAFLLKTNHQERSIPAFAAISLEAMLRRPALRSNFWQRWLDWTG